MNERSMLFLVILTCLCMAPSLASGDGWNIQTVDWADDVGTDTSLAIDPADNPCISYYDVTGNTLKYAYRDGTGWQTESISAQVSGTANSLAIGSDGIPQVSYFEEGYIFNNLAWAWLDETVWRSETMANGSFISCSLALDSSNYPHISYINFDGPVILYTRWNGSTWVDEHPGGQSGMQINTSLALDSTDTPYIAYRMSGLTGGLRCIHWTGVAWSDEFVPGSHNYNSARPSIAMDTSNNPHIAFADAAVGGGPAGPRALKRAWYDGSWNWETIDDSVDVGRYCSMAFGTDNLPRIAYYDATNGDLKFGFWFLVWWISTVDSDGDVGDYCSLALDANNEACISYYDTTNGNLKFARFVRGSTAPPENDFNGDGTSDIAIFRGSSGLWSVRGVTRSYFGTSGDIPVPGDYDGDGTSGIGVFRESSGLWALRDVSRVYFGYSSDQPVPKDYDGNGSSDIGIFRDSSGLWAMRDVSRIYFGTSGDIPVPGDYNGDGTAEVGIFRGSSSLWALRGVSRVYYGTSGDSTVPGDYNGDGSDEVGIFRPSSGLWALRGVTRAYFGSSSDQPVLGDYNGDGFDNFGIFRDISGLWAIRSISRIYFGMSGDIPMTR